MTFCEDNKDRQTDRQTCNAYSTMSCGPSTSITPSHMEEGASCHFPKAVKSCHLCGNTFSRDKHLHKHLQAHEEEKLFKCGFRSCQVQFGAVCARNEHMRFCDKGDDTSRAYCPRCEMPFLSRRRLLLHIFSDACKPKHSLLKCEVCGVTVPSKKYLHRHFELKHAKITLLKCPKCPKTYRYYTSLSYHCQVKHKIPIRKCRKCTLIFESDEARSLHLLTCKRKLGDSRYVPPKLAGCCPLCPTDETERDAESLRIHVIKHITERNPFFVDLTENEFRNKEKEAIMQPLQQTESTREADAFIDNVLKAFSEGLLYPSSNNEEEEEEEEEVNQSSIFMELDANNNEATNATLEQTVTFDSGKKKCPLCNRAFVKSCYFDKHMEDHKKGILFECTNEGCKECYVKSLFRQHKRLCLKRTNVNRCYCPNCHQPFLSVDNLVKHILNGNNCCNNEHIFNCQWCSMSSCHKQAVRKHCKDLHGKNTYTCSHCKEIIASEESVRHSAFCLTNQRPKRESITFCPICMKSIQNLDYGGMLEHVKQHIYDRNPDLQKSKKVKVS